MTCQMNWTGQFWPFTIQNLIKIEALGDNGLWLRESVHLLILVCSFQWCVILFVWSNFSRAAGNTVMKICRTPAWKTSAQSLCLTFLSLFSNDTLLFVPCYFLSFPHKLMQHELQICGCQSTWSEFACPANQHPKTTIKNKKPIYLCAPREFPPKMCLLCYIQSSVIVQSCYFHYGINKPFALWSAFVLRLISYCLYFSLMEDPYEKPLWVMRLPPKISKLLLLLYIYYLISTCYALKGSALGHILFLFHELAGQLSLFLFLKDETSTIASVFICPRTARLRGRPSESFMFVWPGQKFVPLISSVRTRLNLWLTHLSFNFAKYALVQIGPLFENGTPQRYAVGIFDVCLARPNYLKFVPLISSVCTRLNLWLTHLSNNFAKYGLVRIGL